MSHQALAQSPPAVWVQFWHLTKPRVVSLIVFTAVIGMLLATPALPPLGVLALAKKTFAYSIFYLFMLFAALMVDHYLPLVFA